MAKALARRHAQAIFQIALTQKTLDTWRIDLKKLAQVLADEQTQHFWDNPRVRLDNKLSVLKNLFTGVNPLVLNLAGLLMARGRLGIAGDIVVEYERLVDAHNGIEHAEVVTAVPLDEANLQRLSLELGQALGKKITVKAKVDPVLIGGMVVKIGDRVIDGSLKARLENLHRGLLAR